MHCRSLGLLAAGQEVDLLKHRSDPVARIDKLCCQAALPPSSQGQEPTPRLSGVQDRASAGRWGWCSRRTNSLRSVRWRQSIACRSSWPGVYRPVDVARRGQQRPRRSCDFFYSEESCTFSAIFCRLLAATVVALGVDPRTSVADLQARRMQVGRTPGPIKTRRQFGGELWA
jgi:hypothetical protein